jgi:peptidoglycan/xylan/chitin deacetylase (PgdA/CDA1 family)
MTCIREGGYSVITLKRLCNWMRNPVSLKHPAVVLTFDDCYFDQFANAVPVLSAFGYSATFFAVTQWTRNSGSQERLPPAPKVPLMGQDELCELRQLGFEVGCHSRTHPSFLGLASELQQSEILTAKHELEDLLDEDVQFFCFPYGHYTSDSIEAVKSCGFRAATSVRVGAVCPKDDLYTLKRLVIPDRLTEEDLTAQLTWIPQVAEIVRKIPSLEKCARVIWRPR